MKKEEILEASRKENAKIDAYELEVNKKAYQFGALMIIILATIFYIYEIVTGKGSNPAFYSIISTFCAATFGYKGVVYSEKRAFNIFVSVLWTLTTAGLLYRYFKGM